MISSNSWLYFFAVMKKKHNNLNRLYWLNTVQKEMTVSIIHLFVFVLCLLNFMPHCVKLIHHSFCDGNAMSNADYRAESLNCVNSAHNTQHMIKLAMQSAFVFPS